MRRAIMTCPSCHTTSPPGAAFCPRCGIAPIMHRSLIASRYDVLAVVGSGSAGTVYKALDRVRGAVVAVKVLRADLPRGPELDRRLGADLTLAETVRHRNVCRILEWGEHAGRLFLTMEFLEGTSLKQLLRRRGGRPNVEEAFDAALQVCLGLQALHDVGLLHLDLNTRNVFLDSQGLAKLMDLDVAKRSAGGMSGTGTGRIFGSPEYMSPEQVRGAKTDARSDLYALGVVLYELFTGRLPFRGPTPLAAALKHVYEAPPLEGSKAAGIPEPVLSILRKALAKSPERRHGSAQELGAALGLARAKSCAPPRLAPTPDPAPLPVLLGALNPVDATVRMEVVKASAPDPAAQQAIPALLHALNGSTGRVEPLPLEAHPQMSAADAGSPPMIASRSSVAVLIEALKQNDRSVRSKAARELGGIGPGAHEAIPVLLDALRDSEASVRWDAARALGQIGAAAADGLAAAIHDKDPVVRQIVADALRQIIQRKREPVGEG